MAAGAKSAPTFPVWVGNLKETVSEAELRKHFALDGFGKSVIGSCKLMLDKTGKSRRFGWVNFYSRSVAEKAALKLAGYLVQDVPLKTAGPAELEKKGHFSPPDKATKKDFRPLTDCSFFIQDKNCRNGDNVRVYCRSTCVYCMKT